MERDQNHLTSVRFSRRLAPWQAIAQGLGVTTALSLFVVLDGAAAAAGSLTPLSFVLVAIVVMVNAAGYIELSLSGSRTGGAYAQAHKEHSGWLAFLTGWTLVLSSLGACALLAHGFGRQVTTLLHDHLQLTLPVWPWAAGLIVLLTMNNALGTPRSRRGFIAALLAIITLIVVSLAIPNIQISNYTRPHQQELALPLLLAVFIGLEVTTSFQNELRQRDRSLPRVMLLLPLLTGLLGAAVSAVAIGTLGSAAVARSSVPLAALGDRIAGGAGRPLLLIIGALSLGMGLNRAIILAIRQLYLMSKDGYWPAALHQLHDRFGTPTWAIAIAAVLATLLALVPAGLLARLTALLYLLTLMAVNGMLAIRPKQGAKSSFTLPFHPWVPGLTLAIDGLLLFRWPLSHLAGVAGSLLVGIILYLTYARTHYPKAQAGVTVFKSPPEEEGEAAYRILVPLANPATAGTLLRLAGALARQKAGEVLALQVVVVPDQVPLEEGRRRARASRVLLEHALEQAEEEGFTIQAMTRVAHSVAQGILDTAREEEVDLVLLGWRGYTRSFGASMGPVIDAVIRDAPCDVTVAKGDEWVEAKKILVPTAGGPHAPIAAQLAAVLSQVYGAEVTALYVQLGRATTGQMERNKERLARTLDGLVFSHPPEQKVVIAESVVEGILREAKAYDLVLLGASEEGLFDQFLFGSIPQQIAARASKTAVIVRRYGGATEFWRRKLSRFFLRLLPQLNIEEQLELREALSRGAQPGTNYFVLILLSSIIATLGLLLDSAAVVIGAMLVAPLMSPILAFSLGMVLGDVRLVRLSVEAVLKGVALALLLAVFVGILSPFKELTSEITSRIQPTLLDLTVALASGMAGAYALAREEVSAALPGVAIAAALMPPLGVTGLGLAFGDARVTGGAFLLFVANIAAISLAGVAVFMALGIRPNTWRREDQKRIRRGLIGSVLLLLIIAIPLGVIMGGIVQDTTTRQAIQQVLDSRTADLGGELVAFEYRVEGEKLLVIATLRTRQPFDQSAVDATASALGQRLDQEVTLEAIVLPVLRSEDSP